MPYDGVDQILITLGRRGFYGLRNRELIPTDGLVTLRNATLEDQTARIGPGAAIVGSAIAAGLVIQAAIDYWPDPDTQRTLVSVGDGTLRKDNGAGAGWVTLASGLTTSGQVPMWVVAGAELAGLSRKAFHVDRVNAIRVLAADGASVAAIARGLPEWTGSTQPAWLVQAQGYLWAGGLASFPTALYRSLLDDHEDFLTRPYILFVDGRIERTTAGLPYKGGLLVWGFPEGLWWVDLRDANAALWTVRQIGSAGMAGPLNATPTENDVLYVDPTGGWHLVYLVGPEQSPRVSDVTQRQLGRWFRDNVNRAQLHLAQLAWDGTTQAAHLACAGQGQTQKNRRVVLDLALRDEQGRGERWSYWDADRNESLFLRKISGVPTLHMGDASGQIWRLDQAARNRNGSGYVFELFTRDTDFGEVSKKFRGRRKNLRFLQLLYDTQSTGNVTVDVYHDGSRKQSVTFALEPGPPVLPVTLPFILSDQAMLLSVRQRLTGQPTRVAFRILSSQVNFDVSLAGLLVGLETT